MKPSATQIFRSTSPLTCFPLLGSCVFIGFLSWALIPMHYVVDFQVEWPKLLFQSRPQIPCRDIIHVATSISRRDNNLNLCSFELRSSIVATSILCRDISSCLWMLQLVVPDVATSISCRDINLMNCNFQLMVPDVATSIPCRDISSYLCSFQLMSSVVVTSILYRDITSCLCRFH